MAGSSKPDDVIATILADVCLIPRIPSMHVFQDLALEDECLTTGPTVLAWAPDDVEVRQKWLGCESLGKRFGARAQG